MKEAKTVTLQVVFIVVVIVGTVFGISNHFVSKDTFIEFKDGTITALQKKIDTMDRKIDRILERTEKE